MGGNLFKNSLRLSKNEYDTMATFIETILRTQAQRKAKRTQAVLLKNDFGDLDILVSAPKLTIQEVSTLFDVPLENIVNNGKVISFLYQQFQVDLIFVHADCFDFEYMYYGRADFGNLLGRIAHKTGFKLATNGLYFILREGDYQFCEIQVSKNVREVFEFYELNYDRFLREFNSDHDVYRFLISCPYFNKNIYLLENRSNAARVRDKKRKAYHEFLEFIANLPNENDYIFESGTSGKFGYIKNEFFFNKALAFFPEFSKIYQEQEAAFLAEREFKKKFNGEIVKQWTGLENKELGLLMKKIRSMEHYKETLSGMSENERTHFIQNLALEH